MYHPPNPSIHHPHHLWFICTNQNGLQYPPESTTFHPIPPLHFYYYMNQDLLHSKTTCLKIPPTTAHTHMHHPPYNNQLDRFYVLQGIVCSGKCIRILLLLTVPPILHLTKCIIFATIHSIGMPNQTMLQLSSEGFESGSISESVAT